jgi:hypothetical protein
MEADGMMRLRRHSSLTDAAILEDAGGAALSGVRRRHLYRGHQAGAVHDGPDAAVPVRSGWASAVCRGERRVTEAGYAITTGIHPLVPILQTKCEGAHRWLAKGVQQSIRRHP